MNSEKLQYVEVLCKYYLLLTLVRSRYVPQKDKFQEKSEMKD
jgi:hypothetical protein